MSRARSERRAGLPASKFVSSTMADHLLAVIDADHIGQLNPDGSAKGDDWTFVRTAP